MDLVFSQLFHEYMTSGILASNISEDGGIECYKEIPLNYHIFFVVILSIVHLFFLFKWINNLSYFTKQLEPSTFERRFAIISLLSSILTLFFKLKTRKGLFMLNPCHITVLIQIYLMLSKNSPKNRMLHTAWTGWLFGAYMATLVPHLNGLDDFQTFLYYYQHIAIIPFGYLILNRRYGFLRPTWRNHLPAFSTIALYQFWVLAPFSRATMVNLNFALCHSHADPTYEFIGFYYFVVCTFFLNIFSYLARWLSYLQIKAVYKILSIFGLEEPQIIKNLQIQGETPGESKKQ